MAVLGAVENPFMVLCDRLESFPKPTIAAIDGVCVAGGLELVLSCDLRVVSETAQISDMHLEKPGSGRRGWFHRTLDPAGRPFPGKGAGLYGPGH